MPRGFIWLIASTIMTISMSGCNSLDVGQCLMPGCGARSLIRGEPVDNQMTLTYRRSGEEFSVTPSDNLIKVWRTGDAEAPALRLDYYAVTYLDMDNRSLSELSVTSRALPVPFKLQAWPGGAYATDSVERSVPLLTSEVLAVGERMIKELNPGDRPQKVISASVVLHGRLATGNAVQIRFDVPIIFQLESADRPE